MNVEISLSALADVKFKKGDRVICKIKKNEWHLGTVLRSGIRLTVDFDDGADAIIEKEDFKLVKHVIVKTAKRVKPLTDADAKLLYTQAPAKAVKESVPKKTSVLKTPVGKSDFKSRLKIMYEAMSSGDKTSFRFDFPFSVDEWYQGTYEGHVSSTNPRLAETYISKSNSVLPLDTLLKMMWHVRSAHGPIQAPTLYRITTFGADTNKKLHKTKPSHIKIAANNSRKPVTSWSTTPKIKLLGREESDFPFLLAADKIPTKNVLMNTDILHQTARFILEEKEFFGFAGNAQISARWELLIKSLLRFKHEHEHFIYLNNGESLKVVLSERSNKSEKVSNKNSSYLNGKLELLRQKQSLKGKSV